ncbi:MAG: L-lysine 6-transaminase [Bacteroidota bacterium]
MKKPETAHLREIQTRSQITPQEVHTVLGKHILADGFDLVVDLRKSHGVHLFDSRYNRWFLDIFSFFASSPVGMNHPKMTSPEFLEKLARVAVNKPTNSDVYTVEMAEFVDTFARIAMPDYLPHAFFIEGGALGVENALKASFDWKMRKNLKRGFYRSLSDENKLQVIHFRQAFHGRTGYTLSLTNTDPVKIDYFPKFQWPRISNPAIRFPLNEKNLEDVKQREEIAINEIKAAIQQHGHNIAALIIEPIQAEGGDHHFRKEFLEALRALADENDFMLIFDEVQTGIGLTGKMWAHEYFVKPDMMAFGKKTQVCGFLSSTRIDEVEENVFQKSGRLNSTFGGNLIDMVRFAKYLEIIEEEHLVEHAAQLGTYLLEQLRAIEQEFPTLISNTRGLGLFCAMDLPTPQLRDEFRKQLYAKGVLMLGCGERSIRFRPPLIIQREELDDGLQRMRDVLTKMKS